ncbi:MAG: ADP-ribose pyrophosphatase [Gammaproteobacteria bacterium]|nr:MAG: ADP-ribose pyrophosphatase [Gammaproteobacteria bacterium]
MQYQYTIHQQEKAYRGFFKFDRYSVSFDKFSGGQIEQVMRECGKKGDIVAVLPYDPVRDEVLLVEQFRIGMVVRNQHPWTQEIVAGFMDVAGEDAPTTAKRELFEETGCHAKALHALLSYYPSPGGSASQVHIFVAEVDASEAAQHTGLEEEGEDICVHRVPLADIRQKIAEGGITNAVDNATAIIAVQEFLRADWPAKLGI